MIEFIKRRKDLLLAAIIFAVAAFPRLWMLGDIPISLSDDEVREIYFAYSLAKTGSDVFGNFLPLVFVSEAYTYGPLSIYISSLFFLFLDLTPFVGRLPYALLGTLSVIGTYFLVKYLISNRAIALISAFAMSISIWHVQLSRLAHDASYSLFFYILGINLFLRVKRGSIFITLITMFVFFLAFYSYAATRVVFLPFILILIVYKLKDLNKKQLLIIFLFAFLTLSSFAILAKTQDAAKYSTGPFFFMESSETSDAVELRRRSSEAPAVLETLYHNKITYWHKKFIDQYTYAFSPQFLFTHQEGSGIYSTWGRGYLYSFEALFLLLGFIHLIRKNIRKFFFILFMLLASPLPSGLGVSAPTYFVRSEMMIPFLYLIIGAGIYSIKHYISNKKLAVGIFLIIILAYLYSFGGYLTQYYYDWSRTNAKYYSKSTKDLVLLIEKEKMIRDEVIVGGTSYNTMLHYGFYNKTAIKKIQEAMNNEPVSFDNVVFLINCINDGEADPLDALAKNSVYISMAQCHEDIKPNMVIKTYDNDTEVWKIYIKE